MNSAVSKFRRYGIEGILINALLKSLKIIGIKLEYRTIFFNETQNFNLEYNYSFRELSYNDFIGQDKKCPEWFNTEKINNIIKAFTIDGNHAYGLFDNDILCCYGWLSLKQWGLEDTTLKESDAYLWADFVHPSYRGNGFHRQLILYRIEQAARFGKNRILSQVACFNKASRKNYKRLGFTYLETYAKYKYGNGVEHSTMEYKK